MVVEKEIGLEIDQKVGLIQFSRKKSWKLSNFYVDSKYVYGEVTYLTKSLYAGDTGACGAVIRAMEDRLNSILACPEQQRTGMFN